MSEPKKVWAVESGEYEQRGVDAIFATPELAEAHAKERGQDSFVEEYWMYDEAPRRLTLHERRGRVWPCGRVRDEGVRAHKWWEYISSIDDGLAKPLMQNDSFPNLWRDGTTYIVVNGTDEESVEEAYRQRVAAALVETTGDGRAASDE